MDVKELQFRQTDRFVHERTGRWPLSVSADRIAIPAMRAAALFSLLHAGHEPISRDGAGRVTEVYPAAALRVWGLQSQGYKRKENRDARCSLLRAVLDATSDWLSIPNRMHASCEESDDALDALIAALIARAHAIGECEPIPPKFAGSASTEGWIAVPLEGSLRKLAPLRR